MKPVIVDNNDLASSVELAVSEKKFFILVVSPSIRFRVYVGGKDGKAIVPSRSSLLAELNVWYDEFESGFDSVETNVSFGDTK